MVSKIDLYEDFEEHIGHFITVDGLAFTHDFQRKANVIQGGMMVCVGEEKHVVHVMSFITNVLPTVKRLG